jgi:hypothetical protein
MLLVIDVTSMPSPECCHGEAESLAVADQVDGCGVDYAVELAAYPPSDVQPFDPPQSQS